MTRCHCLICAATFRGNHRTRYCSDACRLQARARRWPGHPCRWCGAAIRGQSKVRYCGPACRAQGRAARPAALRRRLLSLLEGWLQSGAEYGAHPQRWELLRAYDQDCRDAARAHLPGWHYPETAAALYRVLRVDLLAYARAVERRRVA